MIDWNIQARAHACQACGKAFADKETFHTLLFDERQGYHRLDVCEVCWKSQFSQGATERKGFVSHWQSIYTPPPAAPPDPIQKDTAETLLRKLVERNNPEHAAARYILAVMLERKRLLKVKAQLTEDGRRIFIYEQPRTGDLFNVADPNLQLNELEQVQRDVAYLLEHGLEPVPGEAPPETSAPAPLDTPVTEEAPAASVTVSNPDTANPPLGTETPSETAAS